MGWLCVCVAVHPCATHFRSISSRGIHANARRMCARSASVTESNVIGCTYIQYVQNSDTQKLPAGNSNSNNVFMRSSVVVPNEYKRCESDPSNILEKFFVSCFFCCHYCCAVHVYSRGEMFNVEFIQMEFQCCERAHAHEPERERERERRRACK